MSRWVFVLVIVIAVYALFVIAGGVYELAKVITELAQ